MSGALAAVVPALTELVALVASNAARVGASFALDQEDAEAVHDFRVALRRLRTLLRPARAIFGAAALRTLGRELGDLGRRTGRLRDEEVLRETLLGLQLDRVTHERAEAWLDRRCRSERRMRRAAAAELSGAALSNVLARLTATLATPKRDVGLPEFGRHAFERPLAEARALSRVPVTRATEMHELRIRVKRLRYSAELFARGEERGGPWAQLGAGAAVLQKKLGTLHDLDEAITRLRRARSLPEPVRRRMARATKLARKLLAVSVSPLLRAEVELLASAIEATLAARPEPPTDESSPRR